MNIGPAQSNMISIQNYNLPQQPPTIKVLFDDICGFVGQEIDVIKDAANLPGGWEGWLQAALAVHLNDLQNKSKYTVARETNVYSQEAKQKARYRELRGTFDKIHSNRALRADLSVTTKTTVTEHFVIELKCESIGMSTSAGLVSEQLGDSPASNKIKELTSNYLTMGVCLDAMKVNLGFNPDKLVKRACICAVVTSKAARDQLDYLKDNAYYKDWTGSDVAVYMWHMAVNGQGQWGNDGHGIGILDKLSEDEKNGLEKIVNSNDQELDPLFE